MQFKFEYQDHKITFISTYTGTDKVYVDGKIVSTLSSSRFKKLHNFFIGEDVFQIKSEITGAIIPKLNVSLFKDNSFLETKAATYNGALDINEIPKMSKDESNWVKEIEIADSTTIMMYGLYGGLIIFTLGGALFDDKIISNIGLGISATSFTGAVISFMRTSYLDLLKK